MNFALESRDFVFTMMDFVFTMMDFVFKMNFCIQMMKVALKWMNLHADSYWVELKQGGHCMRTAIPAIT